MSFIRTAKSFIVVGSVFVSLKAYGMEFEAPSWTNSSSAKYSAWETFSIGFGEPGNTPDVAGSNGGGTIIQTTPGGLVTGSGNIYNPGGASKFTLSNGADRDYQTVLLQVKSIGSLATDTVTLTHESDGQPVENNRKAWRRICTTRPRVHIGCNGMLRAGGGRIVWPSTHLAGWLAPWSGP